ncbi:MAG: alpha/beta fold hydrolase [Gammaproteobacteria bacterium]|nr:alpha/beta fold hydrolase [Gammaproteobacteria bacterium]
MANSETRSVRIRSRHGEADIHTCIAGSGDPVLLVAGLGGRAVFWNAQVPGLAKEFRVITHDHRGTGASSRSPIIYSAEQMADDVVALMDALEIERAHIVGHSTGGSIGQFLALRNPTRVASLVMSACWGGPTELFIETFRLRRQVLITQGPQAYYFLGSLLAMPAQTLGRNFTSLADHVGDRMADFPGLEIELSRLAAVMSHDLRNELGNIKTPSLVIGAEDDQLTCADMQREVAERVPGARLTLLPHGGHFFPVTRSDDYNALILDFLRSQTLSQHGDRSSKGAMS